MSAADEPEVTPGDVWLHGGPGRGFSGSRINGQVRIDLWEAGRGLIASGLGRSIGEGFANAMNDLFAKQEPS